MHIELTVHPTCEPRQNLSLHELRNGYAKNCELFKTKNVTHKLKFINNDSNHPFEFVSPHTISISNLTKANSTFRLEFDEIYGSINLEKFIGYGNMVKPFELIHEAAEQHLIMKSKEFGYCFKLSSDQDFKYGFLNPIYLIALTIAQNCNGYVQINDDSKIYDFEVGIYKLDEFNQKLKKKYES